MTEPNETLASTTKTYSAKPWRDCFGREGYLVRFDPDERAHAWFSACAQCPTICHWDKIQDTWWVLKRGWGVFLQQAFPAPHWKARETDETESQSADRTILKVPPCASADEIKTAWKQLIKEHHPDNGGDEESAKQVNAAYARLRGKAHE